MKVLLQDGATLPKYAKQGDAGLDIAASVGTVIPAGGHVMVRTGVAVEIPEGHYGALVGRSGLALKGIFAHYGTIDSGYRGNLGVILFNMTDVAYPIEVGTRVAQLIIHEYVSVGVIEVERLSVTERGETGFGSSGL